MSKIYLALAGQNTEKCFETKVFGTEDGSQASATLVALNKEDVLVFYKAKEGFAGLFKVVKTYYRDTASIWEDASYPNRIDIEPIIKLDKQNYIDAKTMVDDLEMVKNPLYWGLAFRQNLVEISSKDYELIKSKLEKALSKV